ncbi:MAG: YggT family protein [Anaerolineae bacterium]|nr:YggT family protein [Anaerolineae bacterium]
MIIIYYILLIVELLIFARALLSWFPTVDRSNPIVRFIYQATEPILEPIRKLMPKGSMVDFSPLIVLLIIWVLMQALF